MAQRANWMALSPPICFSFCAVSLLPFFASRKKPLFPLERGMFVKFSVSPPFVSLQFFFMASPFFTFSFLSLSLSLSLSLVFFCLPSFLFLMSISGSCFLFSFCWLVVSRRSCFCVSACCLVCSESQYYIFYLCILFPCCCFCFVALVFCYFLSSGYLLKKAQK